MSSKSDLVSKEKCIIVGSGGHSRVVISYLKQDYLDKYEIHGILDNSYTENNCESILGVSLIDLLDNVGSYIKIGINKIFLAIGDNNKRKETYTQLKKMGFVFPNIISSSAIIDSSVKMGEGNLIAAQVYIGPCVKIGNNNIVNTKATIEHESIIQDHSHIGPGTIICGRVKIDSNVFLGAGSIVKNNLTIEGNILSGIGASIVKSINEPSDSEPKIYVGIPARKTKMIN